MSFLRTITAPFAVVRRNLIWFLLAVYGVAAMLPGPGDQLRRFRLGDLPFSGETLSPTHLLLAVLLFCVGVAIRPDEARNLWRLTRSVTGGLIGSWLLPPLTLTLFALAGSLVLEGQAWQSFLVGAILVVAMPPANSSSIWSELSGGQAAATVSVIILGTLVSPVATPAVVALFSAVFTSAGVDVPISTASLLEVLFAFVMLPAALGIAMRALLEATIGRWVSPLMDANRALSICTLLLLNYVNAAAALPQLVTGQQSLSAGLVAALAAGLCMAVFGISLLAGRRLRTRPVGHRLAFVYVSGMKNTGAALVLAVTLFPEQPQVALVPVLYTLTQHFAAALLDRIAIGRQRVAGAVAMGCDIPQASTPSY